MIGPATKGAGLAARIDEAGKAADGSARLTRKRIEELADLEYERRTRGSYCEEVCATCSMAFTRNGTCDCSPDEGRTAIGRLLASYGLEVPASQRVALPSLADVPPR